MIEITCKGKIDGKTYKKSIIIDDIYLTENIIKYTFLGEYGLPFKTLLLDFIRNRDLNYLQLKSYYHKEEKNNE